MNAFTVLAHRSRWPAWTVVLTLIGTLILSACATPTPTSPTPTSIPPTTSASVTVQAIADDIATEVGQVIQVVEGDPDRIVMMFEETHNSRAGQIEIAIMLNRLYEDYNLRSIGLEGAFTIDGVVDAEWFHLPPPFKARDPIRTREDVIVQLLQEGEINSSEVMALVYSDLTVSGIDDADKYEYKPPQEAYTADTWYLLQIAVQEMTPSQIKECDKLFDPDDPKAVERTIECYVYSDEWTGEKYDLFSDLTVIHSCEEYVEALIEIEAKADEVNADVDSEDEANLQALRKFYEMCIGRDRTMMTAMLSLLEQSLGTPVAMTIGAAHTGNVTRSLAEEGVSFAVIRGNSLANNDENGDLHYQAFIRKGDSLSVDAGGEFSLVGALLEGRKKPPPVIDGEIWFRSKADVYFIADRLAHAVKAGETALTDVLDNLPALENVSVDRDSIEIIGDKVVFSVRTLDNDGEQVTIWIGARTDRERAMLLEERLLEAHGQVKSMDAPNNSKPEPEASHPVRITYDTVMWAAGTREELNTLMTP